MNLENQFFVNTDNIQYCLKHIIKRGDILVVKLFNCLMP